MNGFPDKNCTLNEEEERPWSDLLPELVILILQRLSSINRFCISLALPQWYCQTPFILYFYDKQHLRFTITHPIHQSKRSLKLPKSISSARLLLSHHGWLLLDKACWLERQQDSVSIIFYNPLSKACIELPPIMLPSLQNSFKFCSSAPPTTSLCIVIGAEFKYDRVKFLFCRKGDAEWTELEFMIKESKERFRGCYATSSVFYKGKFYWLEKNGRLGVFDPAKRSWLVHCTSSAARFQTEENFLVESDSNLFWVSQSSDVHFESVKVCKLNFSNYIWEETQSIGGRCFFIGFKAVSLSKCLLEGKGDRIYWTTNGGLGCACYDVSLGCMVHPGIDIGARINDNTALTDGNLGSHITNMEICWVEPRWDQTHQDEINWY